MISKVPFSSRNLQEFLCCSISYLGGGIEAVVIKGGEWGMVIGIDTN